MGWDTCSARKARPRDARVRLPLGSIQGLAQLPQCFERPPHLSQRVVTRLACGGAYRGVFLRPPRAIEDRERRRERTAERQQRAADLPPSHSCFLLDERHRGFTLQPRCRGPRPLSSRIHRCCVVEPRITSVRDGRYGVLVEAEAVADDGGVDEATGCAQGSSGASSFFTAASGGGSAASLGSVPTRKTSSMASS